MPNEFHWINNSWWVAVVHCCPWLIIMYYYIRLSNNGENVPKIGSIQQKQAIEFVLFWFILQSLITNNFINSPPSDKNHWILYSAHQFHMVDVVAMR